MKKPKPKLWSVSRIKNPQYPKFTVRIGEWESGGRLHVFTWTNGKQKSRVLDVRRTDLGESAKAQERAARGLGCRIIEEMATQRASDTEPALLRRELTLGGLADKYSADGFARCTSGYKRDAVAAVRRVATFMGSNVAVRDIKPSSMEKYIAHRIKEGHAPAGRSDLVAVTIACNWAVGERLLGESPFSSSKRARDAMRTKHEYSRPVATPERYANLKAVAPQLPPAFDLLLDLAWHTGHRMGAILTLRWEHVNFDQTADAPHGTIRWYAGVMPDRKKRDHTLPMNERAREALLAWRRMNFPPNGWVFRSQGDQTQPMPRWGAKKWLGKAERLAGLPHLRMGGWHMFRRGWATARKHLPLKDVAAGGGWFETDTLSRCYLHADEPTTRQVVTYVA